MRLTLVASTSLLLAACASTPPLRPVERPAPQPVQQPQRGTLIGLTTSELGARFGAPGFQVREGPGLKLQWSNATCVLDAYLYPPASGGGPERVAHVDTRRPGSGDRTDQAACIASLGAAG